jgi:hypothetical protein
MSIFMMANVLSAFSRLLSVRPVEFHAAELFGVESKRPGFQYMA